MASFEASLNLTLQSLKIDQFTELQSIVHRSTRAYIEIKENCLPAAAAAAGTAGGIAISVTGAGPGANSSGADVLLLSSLFTALVNQGHNSIDKRNHTEIPI